MKQICLIFLFISMILFFYGMNKSDNSYNKTMSVINKYSKIIKKEKGIERRGYGLSYAGPDKVYDGKIHVIDLMYSIDKRMQYEEAKKYFYEMADGLIASINKEEKLREYFYHFPISYQDLRLVLAFDYENKGFLKRDDVDSIHIVDNEIYYFIAEKDGETNEMLVDQVVPDVYVTKGYSSKPRCIVKKLPETE